MKSPGVSQSSIENYRLHGESGALGRQSAKVLAFFERQPHHAVSRAELAVALNMRLSSVCGRANELLKLGHLQEGERRRCFVTGKTIHTICLLPKGQMALFNVQPSREIRQGLNAI